MTLSPCDADLSGLGVMNDASGVDVVDDDCDADDDGGDGANANADADGVADT